MDLARETALAYEEFALGSHAKAAGRAQRILQQSPADPATLTLVGRLALSCGEPDVAHDIFANVLQRHPNNGALWLDLSLALRDLGQHESARDAAQRAVTLGRTDPNAWIKLGESHLSLDEREDAADAFRNALRLEPDDIGALRGLCQAEDVESDSETVRHMEALARFARATPRQIAELHYTLAQVYRRNGLKQQFVHHLLLANAKQRALCSDGRAEYKAIFDGLEAVFNAAALAQAKRAEPVTPVPIFVLGMPRSGTTLVERLLSAHPDVTAGGELDYMKRSLRRAAERETKLPFPAGFETLTARTLTSMAKAYAHRLQIIGNNSHFVTDKTPGNFHLLGLLCVLFPQSRVVHVKRDPMDTCFSILQYPFDDRSPHTCDMQLLAYVYARYIKMMQHWQQLLGERFITVEYERLVASPQSEGRRLFEYCGLDWRDAYLECHQNTSAVRTFSASQVRRPIYSTSVGAWRQYEQALLPLREALDKEMPRTMDSVFQPDTEKT